MTIPASKQERLQHYRAYLCYSNFAFFVKTFWDQVPPGHKLVWNWHLDAICTYLERVERGEIQRLVINMPPGFAKTALVVILYPAWRMLRNPGYSVICGTHTQTFAEDASRKTRMVVESPLYKEVVKYLHVDLGLPLWSMAGDQNAKREFVTSEGGKRQSIGRDTAVMGSRADEVIIDDPIDIQNITSPTEVFEATDWVINRMRTRVNDPRTAKRILVMQRLSEEDPSDAALKEGWTHLKLSMEFDPEDADNCPEDPRKEKGELLFPARFTEKELYEFKRDPRYEEQFNQNTSKNGDRIFKDEYWQYYTDRDWVIAKADRIIISCDPSGVGKEQSKAKNKHKGPDYFVAQVWAAIGMDRYLLDQVRGQWDFVEQLNQLRNLYAQYPRTSLILVEQAATGSSIESVLGRELPVKVEAQPTGRDTKESRAKAIVPSLKEGEVYLPVSAPWLNDFLQECKRFPKVKNDDQVDTTVIALLKLKMTPEEYITWVTWLGGSKILEEKRKMREMQAQSG